MSWRTRRRWRRELRQLEREASNAYDNWMRAHYAYADTIEVLGYLAADKARDEQTDRMNEYLELDRKCRRMREVGPAWTS